MSTRRITHLTGTFTRETPGSQSLERGLALLRAFRPGTATLGNAELAERTGLPRPTVSRLTRSLVDAGFLAYDLGQRAYRLQPVVLSLAQAFRAEARLLDAALPAMEAVARGRQINVGMAVADQLEMVYLESVRYSRLGVFRRIAAGSRVPIATTSLGCAYLAGATSQVRNAALAQIAARMGAEWSTHRRAIDIRLSQVRRLGYCRAQWSPGMMAIATPLVSPDGTVHALNISFPLEREDETAIERRAAILLPLAVTIRQTWQKAAPALMV